MSELDKFNETVSILVKAYFDGTLQHGDCHACAVGNIIAAKMGYKVVHRNDCWMMKWIKEGDVVPPNWTTPVGMYRNKNVDIHTNQTLSTGYTLQQLERIEYAFEFDVDWLVFSGKNHLFQSLMSVVNVLADIHGVDLSVKEESKKLFVR